MVSLYRHSLRTAKNEGDLDRWRASLNENIRCRDFIDKIISEKYDGRYVPAESWEETVKEFGYDRTMWVLANTILQRNGDKRFSADNVKWAKDMFIPKDRNADFVLKTHSGIVDMITENVRSMYAQLGLFDSRHMIPDSDHENFEGKLLIIRDTVLKEECRTPENQLFLAESGFGCDPSKVGRKVFGTFLSDGEYTHFDRSDFVGIIAEEHIPEWVKEKMEQIAEQQSCGDSPAPKLGM
ncbi:MAG: DUF3849 domain-containing protein [Ruminiclostridium sp.]|nr:DUF3849 domain-containing protein [Ruminiclostridium sp.]